MIIKTDKEGADAVKGLCDIGLKQTGLQGLQAIVTILNSIKEEPKVEEKKPE
jgi:hypothetical protein